MQSCQKFWNPAKVEFMDEDTHRLVGDGELSQVVSNHLWLHLNLGVQDYCSELILNF